MTVFYSLYMCSTVYTGLGELGGGRPGHGLANILHPFHTDMHTMSLGVASFLYTFLSNDSCG